MIGERLSSVKLSASQAALASSNANKRPPAGKKPTVTLAKTFMFMAMGLVGSVAFDALNVAADADKSATRPIVTSPISMAEASSASSVLAAGLTAAQSVASLPIDEYGIKPGVEKLIATTNGIRAVVDGMPGPNPKSGKPPRTPSIQYAHLYDETLDRLKNAAQLVAEITRIIQSMPTPAIPRASPLRADQALPAPAVESAPVVEATPSAPAISASSPAPTPVIAPAEPATPAAVPAPATARSTLSSIDAGRLIALICGVLIAFALVRYLPRLFQNGKFERTPPDQTQSAAVIEAPPLKDPALELADIMSSMGLTDGAAHALVERIRANPRQALSHWLKLLEVYRQAGKQEEFEHAAEQLRTTFNVKPGSWNPKTEDRDTSASLENYPHIATQLKKLWPKPECSDYLLGLLADNREGKRAGFPLRVVEEIVLLLAVLRDEEQAQPVPEAAPA